MSSYNNPLLPSCDELNDYEHGVFVLTNLAAKRAKQLKSGAPPLVRIDSNHPLTVALAEISAGMIRPNFGSEDSDVLVGAHEAVDEAQPLFPTLETGFLLPALDEAEAELFKDEDAIGSLLSDDDIAEPEDQDGSNISNLLDSEEEATPADVVEPSIEGSLSLSDIAEEEDQDDQENND
jgi:DNA-directed RNA polymerase subunit omega